MRRGATTVAAFRHGILGTVLLAFALCGGVAGASAAEVVRVRVEDPLLDRNGDGFQDTIIGHRAVHTDLDFDGRFDYSISLAFKEYSAEGHRRYIASGHDSDVFSELTLKGIDALCATEQLAAEWTKKNHGRFGYYRDGYGRLALFDGSPENDGRLTSEKPRFGYDLVATFNPDGTVRTVQRGDRTVSLAAFDFETSTSSGTKILLPKISGPEDLAAVRATLEGLLPVEPLP